MKFDGKRIRFAAFLEAPLWLLVLVAVVVTALVIATSFVEL